MAARARDEGAEPDSLSMPEQRSSERRWTAGKATEGLEQTTAADNWAVLRNPAWVATTHIKYARPLAAGDSRSGELNRIS